MSTRQEAGSTRGAPGAPSVRPPSLSSPRKGLSAWALECTGSAPLPNRAERGRHCMRLGLSGSHSPSQSRLAVITWHLTSSSSGPCHSVHISLYMRPSNHIRPDCSAEYAMFLSFLPPSSHFCATFCVCYQPWSHVNEGFSPSLQGAQSCRSYTSNLGGRGATQ